MLNVFLGIMFFLYGTVIGSFLNVCIYRIPHNENMVTTRSHCMECGTVLKWYDLIPLLSIVLLRGRCRNCKAKISIQYPIVEGLNGILYATVFLANGINVRTILYCLLASALIVLSVIDWRTYEIPPVINLFILLLGVVGLVEDYQNWLFYIIGMVCVSGVLYLIYLVTKGRGIGGGDIKLMASAGLLLGWKGIVFAFLSGCIIGSVCHLIRMAISKDKNHVLAFGPYLSIGILLAVFVAEGFFDWYLSLIL